MNLKLVVAIAALVAIPALAQAQQGNPPTGAPKPSKADVQKVVQLISDDKTKSQAYCDLSKLNDQMMAADRKKDAKALDELGKKADALIDKLGPEYTKMMDGLDQVDENSAEGKEYIAILAALDKLCTK